jgi:hypothetical protein
MKVVKILSLIALLTGMAACNNNNQHLEKAYKMAVSAGDYHAASNALVLWINQDSSIGKWGYDSLAYIHYFHLGASGNQVRNPKPLFFMLRRDSNKIQKALSCVKSRRNCC